MAQGERARNDEVRIKSMGTNTNPQREIEEKIAIVQSEIERLTAHQEIVRGEYAEVMNRVAASSKENQSEGKIFFWIE